MALRTKRKFQISMKAGNTVPASLDYSTLSLQTVQIEYFRVWESGSSWTVVSSGTVHFNQYSRHTVLVIFYNLGNPPSMSCVAQNQIMAVSPLA